jgi:hypothetical protein
VGATIATSCPGYLVWSLINQPHPGLLPSDLCDLALLKPLWQLFTHMEYSLFEDVTQPGILLPLHRALTELFFVTENRAQVRALSSSHLKDGAFVCFCPLLAKAGLGSQSCVFGQAYRGRAGWPSVSPALGSPQVSPRLLVLSGLKPKCFGSALDDREL